MSELQIADVIELIPEDRPTDEALYAIETITLFGQCCARVLVHLTHKFRLTLTLSGGRVAIEAEGRPTVGCSVDGTPAALRRVIYEIDEAIEAGSYRQSQPRDLAGYVFQDDPPPGMDIPVWDPERKRWYDAEY